MTDIPATSPPVQNTTSPSQATAQLKKKQKWDPSIPAEHEVSIPEKPNDPPHHFSFARSDVSRGSNDNFVIVGFDTEYQVPHSTESLDPSKAQNIILSYQFFAETSNGENWTGIAIPEGGKRISLGQFLAFVIAKGKDSGAIQYFPSSVTLVGHYDRADLAMFEERKDIFKRLQNVRKSFVSGRMPLIFRYRFSKAEDDFVDLNINVQDTYLLAPTGKQSLGEVGKLVGYDKISLHKDPRFERHLKKNMSLVLNNEWDLFKRYAIADAEICVRYYKKIRDQYQALQGDKNVPATLSSIALKLLQSEWADKSADTNELIGREIIEEKVWVKKHWRYQTKKSKVFIEKTSWFIDFATECYHGGRNEQMWFGPSREDDWTDYDLTSAYPTAMATIRLPDWRNIRPATSIDDLLSAQIGLACVDFEFPADVRYPTLPVRSENGLIFPLSGRSYCATPELQVSRALGCKIKEVIFGLVIPQRSNTLVFFDFIKMTIGKRAEATTEIEKSFWKELTNSAYGKIAQGLRAKRVFNIKEENMEDTHESAVTNPYYAAYITSFVRAVVGEIINQIPRDTSVFSVTTDGFITNATDSQIAEACNGPIVTQFKEARRQLTGKADVLSEKHGVRQLLGIKTRGQATLKPLQEKPANVKDDYHIVLAKTGIKPPMDAEKLEEQNDYIIKRFLTRKPDEKFPLTTLTTVREMIIEGSDLVSKTTFRTNNMDYDFKREPQSPEMIQFQFDGQTWDHLAFTTRPWKSPEHFRFARQLWDNYRINPKDKKTLKTVADYDNFAKVAEIAGQLKGNRGKYLSKKGNAALSRLQRDICRAFKRGRAGFAEYQHLKANDVADFLNDSGLEDHGVVTTRYTVENGRIDTFEPHSTPRTPEVLEIVEHLSVVFPAVDWDIILTQADEQLASIEQVQQPSVDHDVQ